MPLHLYVFYHSHTIAIFVSIEWSKVWHSIEVSIVCSSAVAISVNVTIPGSKVMNTIEVTNAGTTAVLVSVEISIGIA